MPRNLFLVRHGESEGNVANRASRQGSDHHFTDDFRRRHSSQWRLTDKGISQAQAAAQWFKDNWPYALDRRYTSEYLRAMETSGHLGLAGPWLVDFYLRERDWGGGLDVMPDGERKQRFAEEMARRERDGFYWNAGGGESLATLCLRIDRVLQTLHRECDNKNVIIVCHGEVMWAFRVRLERMTQQRFRELDSSKDPKDNIHNCQILHYTRDDPQTAQNHPYLNYRRSIWPVDPSQSSNSWEQIQRPRFTGQDLLELVTRQPRLVNG